MSLTRTQHSFQEGIQKKKNIKTITFLLHNNESLCQPLTHNLIPCVGHSPLSLPPFRSPYILAKTANEVTKKTASASPMPLIPTSQPRSQCRVCLMDELMIMEKEKEKKNVNWMIEPHKKTRMVMEEEKSQMTHALFAKDSDACGALEAAAAVARS